MFHKKFLIQAVLPLFILLGCTGSDQNIPEHNVRAEVLADLGGNAHGLTFDKEGNIYAAISGIKSLKSPRMGRKFFCLC
jgi:hypothetical protein